MGRPEGDWGSVRVAELALSRYEIRGVLGRGGSGVVYEAFDTQDRSLVALKTISDPLPDELFRLKQEFRVLADIHHPNLVRYGELTCERGQWFFTMELLRGCSFSDYVRPSAPVQATSHEVTRSDSHLASHVQEARERPVVFRASPAMTGGPNGGGAVDEERLRSALGQLVSALVAVHATGRVHRDVKPANILVTDEGRVVLLDFGLATALAHTSSEIDDVVGTPAYMAPEQAEGGAVGSEVDWYAVGVVLFAALTGTLPFDGSTADIIAMKMTFDAPAPHDRVAGVPPDLDALCIDLLRRAPADRPRGHQIAARLGLPASEQFPSSVRALDVSTRFVGRGGELRTLEAELAAVRAGSSGGTVIVEGDPGIGKSALVQRFLDRLARDVIVLSGRCYEQESVPFKGLDGVVDALSDQLMALPDREVQPLLLGGIRYLTTVFPILQRVPAIASTVSRTREVADPSALREQAWGELERLLGALGQKRLLVIFVDDLQWADEDSLLLLERLRGEDAPRCLFVATLRSGGSAAWEGLAWVRAATQLRLQALSPDEARTLLDGSASAGAATARRLEALIAEAQGHPLFLAELARRSAAGDFESRPEASLMDVLWQHVTERDETDRRILEMVAVAGVPLPYDVIARAAGIEAGECQTRLAPLRAAQLLRVGRRGRDRVIEPYHDRIREAILARLKVEGAEAGKHLRLGRALLEGNGEADLAARVFTIVWHLNAAESLLDSGDRRRAAELNLLASRQAQLATAYAASRNYALAGLSLLGALGWSDAYPIARDLLLARLVAESFAGDDEGAEACFDEARIHLESSADRTRLYTIWIGLRTSRGQHEAAIESGRERLRELGTHVSAKPSQLAVLRQYVACQIRQGRRSIPDLLHLPQLSDPAREGVIELVVAMAPAAFFVDTNLLAWLELEGVAISLRHGVSEVSSYAFAVYGTVLTAVFSKHEEGEAFGRLALALNERFQNHKLAARLHFLYGGWHASWVRPFKDGLDFLKTSHELATKYGDTAYETYAASTRALVAFSEAASLLSLQVTSEWAMEVGARRQDADMTGFAEVFARYAAALRGQTSGAQDLSRGDSSDVAFRATLTDARTPSSVYYYLYCDAELAWLSGDAERALGLLDQAWQRIHIVFGLPTFVDLTFLDALVAARLHDGASWSARGTFKRRVARRVAKLRGWARSSPSNFEAYHLIAAAELARVRGDTKQATLLFERAITAARAHRSPKREILALELAAAHAERVGDVERASALWTEAADACGKWGAAGDRLTAPATPAPSSTTA